jgi:hypothetical protein
MAKKHIEIMFSKLSHKLSSIQTTLRFHLTHVRMAFYKEHTPTTLTRIQGKVTLICCVQKVN